MEGVTTGWLQTLLQWGDESRGEEEEEEVCGSRRSQQRCLSLPGRAPEGK